MTPPLSPTEALLAWLLLSATVLPPGAATAGAFPGRRAAWALGVAGAVATAGALACAAGGASLWRPAALGSLYVLALSGAAAALAGALARVGMAGPVAALLAMIPVVIAGLSIFVVGTLVSSFPFLAPAFPWILRISPVTAIGGSILGVDLLRVSPLYDLVPLASEAPYSYGTAGDVVLIACAAFACTGAAWALAGRRASRPCARPNPSA